MGAIRQVNYSSQMKAYIENYWYQLLLVQTLFLELYIVAPNFLSNKRPAMWGDEKLFAYSGWMWTQGHPPYLFVWDVKPPGIHVLSSLFSILSGGSPYVHALLNTGAMVTAVVVSTLLLGTLVFHHTRNEIAAYAAGSFPLMYPLIYRISAIGLRPKHFVVAFGLFSILCYLRDQWFRSGISAALAAGFWQLGLIFPLLVVWFAGKSRPENVRNAFAGILTGTGLVLLPVVLSGSEVVEAMLVQVLLAPIATPESVSLGSRMSTIVGFFGPAIALFALGIVGCAIAAVRENGEWLTITAAWFLLQIVFLDLDGKADMFIIVMVLGVGFGLLIDHSERPQILLGLLVSVIGISIYQAGGLQIYVQSVAWDYQTGSLDWLYWEQQLTETCHVRNSPPEKQFVRRIGESLTRTRCSYDFPTVFEQIFGFSLD